MVKTAALPETPKNSVRVLWVGSLANNSSPYPGGINWDDINFEKPLPGLKSMIVPLEGRILKYGQSKAANIIMAAELAKRLQGTGVLSLVSTTQSPMISYLVCRELMPDGMIVP